MTSNTAVVEKKLIIQHCLQ